MEEAFWIIARGTGIAAILLSSLSVSIGLLAGRNRPFILKRATEKKEVHEALTLATIVMIIAHGGALSLDPWIQAGMIGVIVPFAMDYRPFFSGLGVVAGWGMIVLGLSYYARRWIGVNRWRVAHRFAALFWILGLVHTFGAGSDTWQPWLVFPVIITSVPALILLVLALGGRRPGGPEKSAPATLSASQA